MLDGRPTTAGGSLARAEGAEGGSGASAATGSAMRALPLREDSERGVYVEGAAQVPVRSAAECLGLLRRGEGRRAVAATALNAHSSRSHAVLALDIERRQLRREGAGEEGARDPRVYRGRLFLVDLAGSERAKRSGALGLRLSEAKAINRSLGALGQCIAALADDRRSHIPYRDSKLTRLLQDALGGNSRTSLVVTVSGAVASAGETFASLQFGQRARRVKVLASLNRVMDYKALAEKLQARLDAREDGEEGLQLALQKAHAECRRWRAEAERMKGRAEEAEARLGVVLGKGVDGSVSISGADGGKEAHLSGGGGDADHVRGTVSTAVTEVDIARRLDAALRAEAARHGRALAGVRRELEERLQREEERADAEAQAREALEYEAEKAREEVLSALQGWRGAQAQLLETEEDLGRRVTELKEEVERLRADGRGDSGEGGGRGDGGDGHWYSDGRGGVAGGSVPASVRIADAEGLRARAEGQLRTLQARVERDMVPRDKVAEMERLYTEALVRLKERVDRLEAERQGLGAGPRGGTGASAPPPSSARSTGTGAGNSGTIGRSKSLAGAGSRGAKAKGTLARKPSGASMGARKASGRLRADTGAKGAASGSRSRLAAAGALGLGSSRFR